MLFECKIQSVTEIKSVCSHLTTVKHVVSVLDHYMYDSTIYATLRR